MIGNAVFRWGVAVTLLASSVHAQSIRPLPRPGSDPVVSITAVERSILPVARPADLMRGRELRLALSAARRGDWDEAGAMAAKNSDVAADIIEWQRLRAGKGTFTEYRVFLDNNADWPGLKLLRRKGEATIPETSAAVHVINYFAPQPPQTGSNCSSTSTAAPHHKHSLLVPFPDTMSCLHAQTIPNDAVTKSTVVSGQHHVTCNGKTSCDGLSGCAREANGRAMPVAVNVHELRQAYGLQDPLCTPQHL